MFGLIWRMIKDAFDPVCQDKSAIIMGEHRGYVVQLVPVVEADGHVKEWVPDRDDVAEVDEAIDGGKAPDLSKGRYATAIPAPAAPSAPPALPPALPPPQPTFNPAGVPGI